MASEDGKRQALIAAAKEEYAKVKALKPWLGFSLAANKSSDDPVRTKDVATNSPASFAGLVNGEALYTSKGMAVSSISDFIKTISGMQVGDKIPLELADAYNHRRTTVLIVGSQAANTALVNAVVRIVVDGAIQDADYELHPLKLSVDAYLRSVDTKSKSDGVLSPEPARPSLKGRGCAFGYKPHQFKKDTCSVCGQPESAHGGGGASATPTSPPTSSRDDEAAAARKKKDEEEQKAKQLQLEKDLAAADEARKRREQEEEERKRKEAEKRRREEEAAAAAAAEAERQRAKEREDEEKRQSEVSSSYSSPAAAAQPKPTGASGPRKSTKCPFGYKPHPVKKGFCSVCGQPESAHGDGASATPAPTPAASTSSYSSPAPVNKEKEDQDRRKQEEERERLEREREEREIAELEKKIEEELARKAQIEAEERELEKRKNEQRDKEESEARKKQQEREAADRLAAQKQKEREREIEKEREAQAAAAKASSSALSSPGGDDGDCNFEPVHLQLFKRKCKHCGKDIDLHKAGGGGGGGGSTSSSSSYDKEKEKEKEREREREKAEKEREKRDKEERDRREKEERDRREKEDRERRAEKEKAEKAERDRAEKAKKDKEERERQEKLAKEKLERERASRSTPSSSPAVSKPSSAANSRRGSGAGLYGLSTLSSDGKRITLRIRRKPYGPTEACGFFEPIHAMFFTSFCHNCSEHFTNHTRRGTNVDDEFEILPHEWSDAEWRWKPTKGQTARAMSDSERKALEKEKDKEKEKVQAQAYEKARAEKEHRDAMEAKVAALKEAPKSTACSNFEPVHPQFFAKKCKNCSEDLSAHGAASAEESTSSQPRAAGKVQTNWVKEEAAPEETKDKAPASTGKLKDKLGVWASGGPVEETVPTKKDEEGDSMLSKLRTGGTGSLKAQWEAASAVPGGEPAAEKPKAGGGGKFVAQAAPQCSICNKACYPQESVTYEKILYHKTCFKCLNCKSQVSLTGVAMLQGKLYCKTCFTRLFKTRGKYEDL